MPPELSPLAHFLANNGAGLTALLVIFWLVWTELPAQRLSREKMIEKMGEQADRANAHVELIVKDFRAELSNERHACAAERVLDRQARHASANAVQSVAYALQLLAENIPHLNESQQAAVNKVRSELEKSSEANAKA